VRRETKWLTAILVIAAILRCVVLSTRSIFYDDAFSIFLSEQSLSKIITGTAADTMPPLYYFLLHIWLLAGRSLWWVRLLSVLLSVGSVWMIHRLIADMGYSRAGLWAAFFTAINPFQIYHAQEVRMYSLLAFALLGFAWFFLKIWKQAVPGWGLWLGLFLCGSAALYTHNLAAFSLIVPAILTVVAGRWKLLPRLMGAYGAMGLAFLPWLVMVPGQVEKIQKAFWTPRPGVVEIINALVQSVSSLPLPVVPMAIVLGLSLLIIILIGLEAWRARHTPWLGWLLAWVIIPPALLFVVSYVMRPVFVLRGFILSQVVFLGFAAVVITVARQKGALWLVGGSFILAAIIGLPAQYTFQSFPRSPYREMIIGLREQVTPEAIVLHDNKLSFFPSFYFDPGLPQAFLGDEPGSHNDTYAPASQQAIGLIPEDSPNGVIETHDEIFFVVYQQTLDEYAEMGYDQHPVVATMERSMQPAGQEQYGDLLVIHYVKPERVNP